MAKDPPKQQGTRYPSHVAGDDFELQQFADAHGLTMNQAMDLVEKHGKDRETLDREAKKLA